MTTADAATLESHRRLLAVEPEFSGIVRIRDLCPSLPPGTLLHAGPPFEASDALPAPVMNAAAAAALQEGLAETPAEARQQIESGAIHLLPAQDFGIVTPLAFVAGPSVWAVVVRDKNAPDNFCASPLNDGAPGACLRFGVDSAAGKALLSALTGRIGEEIASAFAGPAAMLPILASALRNGDDLHGQVAATNALIRSLFPGPLSPEAEQYFKDASQFALNVIMATSALMLQAGRGVEGSRMVVACGGNGRALGVKLAARPDEWITLPATRPVGMRMPGKEASTPLPAIGDSAVIDAVGFGAACLRFAPALYGPLADVIAKDYGSEAAHAPFIGPHPALDLPGLKVGLDLDRPRHCLGIMLGMVEETGQEGLIGRGVAPWPEG